MTVPQMESQGSFERRQDVQAVQELRAHVDKRLSSQDATLVGIARKLDDHIDSTTNWKTEIKPALEAITTMKSGVQVLGWIGSKFAALIAGAAAVFGVFTAWHNWKP
jgi:hypothetical protein